jgi:hypothetical protein
MKAFFIFYFLRKKENLTTTVTGRDLSDLSLVFLKFNKKFVVFLIDDCMASRNLQLPNLIEKFQL